jgi:hypothetical protein
MYCSVEDVLRYGVSRGALKNPAREVTAIVSGNVFVWAGHNLELNAKLEFVAFPGGTLPGGVLLGVSYYAIPTAVESRFQVAASPDGAAVSLSSSGSKFGVVLSLRELIETHIRGSSQRIHKYIPAHQMPVTADENGRYPESIRHPVAVFATHATCMVLGQRNALVADEVAALRNGDLKLLLDGLPTRDTKLPTTRGNLALSGQASTAGRPL